jgi:hypothetical protein
LEGFLFLSLTDFSKDSQNEECKKNIEPDLVQYTHLISFTPSANKPGELHRINILVIEIGFPKKSGPAVPTQTQFQMNQIAKMTK